MLTCSVFIFYPLFYVKLLQILFRVKNNKNPVVKQGGKIDFGEENRREENKREENKRKENRIGPLRRVFASLIVRRGGTADGANLRFGVDERRFSAYNGNICSY